MLNSLRYAPAVVELCRALNLKSPRVCLSKNDLSDKAAPFASNMFWIICAYCFIAYFAYKS
nr:MAG TPA: hypothetical protein [Bacteriophage sp.]